MNVGINPLASHWINEGDVVILPKRILPNGQKDLDVLTEARESFMQSGFLDLAEAVDKKIADFDYTSLVVNDHLTSQEVDILKEAVQDAGLERYGFFVNTLGIRNGGGEIQSALENPGQIFESIFSKVKDTVLFSGHVQLNAYDIKDYVRLEFNNSMVISCYAKIDWVPYC